MTQPLTDDDARRLLDDDAVVPAVQVGLAEAKEIQAACLENGVPALLGKDDHCVSGCAPKVLLLVRQDDLDAVRAIMERKWRALLDNVGDRNSTYVGVGIAAEDEGEPPCPACGSRAPLSDGACGECGLQLAES